MDLLGEILEWVQGALRKNGVSELELKRRIQDERVSLWPIPTAAANDVGEENPQKLAEEIFKSAARDAKCQSGEKIGYIVYARPRDPDARHLDSMWIDVPGKGARKPGELGELEAADAKGLTAQSMRQNENLHRMMVGSAEQREQSLLRQIAMLEAKNDALQLKIDKAAGERMKIVLLAEELAGDHLEREMQRSRMRLDERKHEFLESKLEDLLPIALNRLTSGGPGKGMPVMGEQMLMRFLGSLSPEQMQAAITTLKLTETQTLTFLEIYNSYGDKFKRLEAERKRAHAIPGDPANGVAGAASPAPEETEEAP